MSSKPSAELPPEYFVDRSLGKLTAGRLRADGWLVHLIADTYPKDAEDIQDEEWITEGCHLGWILLTKDKMIRYRAEELAALVPGNFLFCLVKGDWPIEVMASAFDAARGRIERAIARGDAGFWHVYRDGKIRRMWPARK